MIFIDPFLCNPTSLRERGTYNWLLTNNVEKVVVNHFCVFLMSYRKGEKIGQI